MDHGHPDAWRYPIGFLLLEAGLVIDRVNGLEAVRGRVTQAAVAAAPNGLLSRVGLGKTQKAFEGLLKALTGDRRG